MENPASKNVDPYQMPHYVASNLGLHCLSMILFIGFLVRMGYTMGKSCLQHLDKGKVNTSTTCQKTLD